MAAGAFLVTFDFSVGASSTSSSSSVRMSIGLSAIYERFLFVACGAASIALRLLGVFAFNHPARVFNFDISTLDNGWLSLSKNSISNIPSRVRRVRVLRHVPTHSRLKKGLLVRFKKGIPATTIFTSC